MNDRAGGKCLILALACAALIHTALRAQPALQIRNFEVHWLAVRMEVRAQCGSGERRDLSEANFLVTENGNRIESFTVTCPAPGASACVSVALVADRSLSMGWGSPSGLDGEKEGFKSFIDSLDQSGAGCDEAALISFNQYATLDVPMTRDKVLLKQGVDLLAVGGNTAVWDAAMTAVEELVAHGTQPGKSIILLTDGEDNSSSWIPDSIIARAAAARIRIFTVGLGGGSNEADLKRIAEQTGGGYYTTANPSLIGVLMSEISAIIHQTYCELEYMSSCPDGTNRNGQVTLRNLPGCSGSDTKSFQFYAPSDPGAFGAAPITAGGVDAGAAEIVEIPVTLDSAVNFSFNASTIRIRIDTQYCSFLGLSTAGSLLDGVPVSATQYTGNTVQIRIAAGRKLAGPGVLFTLRMRAAAPPRSVTTPLHFESWLFDGGCLIPRLTDGEIRIQISMAITRQPENQTACRGRDIQLTALVTGDQPLLLQWQKSSDGGARWSDEPGADRDAYLIPAVNAPLYDSTLWRLLLTRPGGDTLYSAPAMVALLPSVTVLSDPSDQISCPGLRASFTASPSFNTGVTRAWQSSSDGGATWQAVPGAAADTLAIAPVTGLLQGMRFRILYTDSCGGSDTSAAARLRVEFPPVLLQQPAGDSACENDAARFIARSQSASDRRVWQRSTDGGSTFFDLPGETRDTLDLPAVRLWQDGERYRLRFMTICDTVVSGNAALRVEPAAPGIVSHPKAATICEGDSVRFAVGALPATGYQWKKNGVDIPGATFSSYLIASAARADSGVYSVLVRSRCGFALSNPARLTVGESAAILSQPLSQSVKEGDTVRFSVSAAGSGLSWQWMKDGVPIPGATGPDYSLFPVKKSDEGRYTVLVSGSCGPPVLSAAAQLTVTIVSAERDLPLPGRAMLEQNFPNPFTGATSFSFTLPARQRIRIALFDVYGREIRTLADGEYDSGRHSLRWHAGAAEAGVYELVMRTPEEVLVRRMILMR